MSTTDVSCDQHDTHLRKVHNKKFLAIGNNMIGYKSHKDVTYQHQLLYTIQITIIILQIIHQTVDLFSFHYQLSNVDHGEHKPNV